MAKNIALMQMSAKTNCSKTAGITPAKITFQYTAHTKIKFEKCELKLREIKIRKVS